VGKKDGVQLPLLGGTQLGVTQPVVTQIVVKQLVLVAMPLVLSGAHRCKCFLLTSGAVWSTQA